MTPAQYGYKRGGSKKWIRTQPLRYLSPRYGKWVIIDVGYESDGATGAFDVPSNSWWIHDKICDDGTWFDGTPCTRWQASSVLHDILRSEAIAEENILKWCRSKYWFIATYYFGCIKTKRKWLPWSIWRNGGNE